MVVKISTTFVNTSGVICNMECYNERLGAHSLMNGDTYTEV